MNRLLEENETLTQIVKAAGPHSPTLPDGFDNLWAEIFPEKSG